MVVTILLNSIIVLTQEIYKDSDNVYNDNPIQ